VFVVLAAGKYWWLASATTITIMAWVTSACKRHITDMVERLRVETTMGSDTFMELRDLTAGRLTMLRRVDVIVMAYLAFTILDSSILRQAWQGPQAWKSQVCEQVVELLVIASIGFTLRPVSTNPPVSIVCGPCMLQWCAVVSETTRKYRRARALFSGCRV
jgi:hypothetical protein